MVGRCRFLQRKIRFLRCIRLVNKGKTILFGIIILPKIREKYKNNMCNKKEQERDELHRAIWTITDDLGGAAGGWTSKIMFLHLKLLLRRSKEVVQKVADKV